MVRCAACGFAWIPEGVVRTSRGASIYEDDELNLFAPDADYYRDETAVGAADEKLEWVGRFVPAGGRLLDVGANVGTFVRAAMARFDTVGIEPNSAAVAWARQHLGATVEPGSIFTEVPSYVGAFDGVTLFDVIEHLDAPVPALQQCRRYLAPGGRLFVTTPDMASLGARLLGRDWYYIDIEQHVSMFSTANLTRLLQAQGFRVVARRTFGRQYRFSYIERRLRDLSRESALLRVARILAAPLRLAPERRVAINLGDVVGIVAEAAE
jgi:2-polyprenyl-3-methyl-5-hydroxy-6-metoxy-1,4-benzoquinol methylase